MKTSVGVTLLLIFSLAPLYAQTDLTTHISGDHTSLKHVFDSIRLLAMQHSLRVVVP